MIKQAQGSRLKPKVKASPGEKNGHTGIGHRVWRFSGLCLVSRFLFSLTLFLAVNCKRKSAPKQQDEELVKLVSKSLSITSFNPCSEVYAFRVSRFIPLYLAASRCISLYFTVSRCIPHIPLYPAPLYPAVFRRIPNISPYQLISGDRI